FGLVRCLYTPRTKLLATKDSLVEKKPRACLSTRRSSSVNPFGSSHIALSAAMLISLGIQWFAHPARYLAHAQWYLSGTIWFRSARQLMICFSSTLRRRPPSSTFSKPVFPPVCGREGEGTDRSCNDIVDTSNRER